VKRLIDILRKVVAHEKSHPTEKRKLVKYYIGRSFCFHSKWLFDDSLVTSSTQSPDPTLVRTVSIPIYASQGKKEIKGLKPLEDQRPRLGEYIHYLNQTFGRTGGFRFSFLVHEDTDAAKPPIDFIIPPDSLSSYSAHTLTNYVVSQLGGESKSRPNKEIIENFLNAVVYSIAHYATPTERTYMTLGDGDGNDGLVVCSGAETLDILKPHHAETHGVLSDKVRHYPQSISESIKAAEALGSEDVLLAIGAKEGVPNIKAINLADLKFLIERSGAVLA
jgi:hypothetical protein